MQNIQIAREVFLNNLDTMKKILDLIAFKTDEKSKEYCYYKKEIMNHTYKNLKKIFKTLSENKVIKKCSNKCNLRQGYSKCECGGSGYCNAD